MRPRFPSWDHAASRAERSSSTPPRIGFEFDTFAHPRGNSRNISSSKMSYSIADIDPVSDGTIHFISTTGNARSLKSVQWTIAVISGHGGAGQS